MLLLFVAAAPVLLVLLAMLLDAILATVLTGRDIVRGRK